MQVSTENILGGQTPGIIFLILLIIGRSNLSVSQITACNEPWALNGVCTHVLLLNYMFFNKNYAWNAVKSLLISTGQNEKLMDYRGG